MNAPTARPVGDSTVDVIVIGDGVIGLSIALELAQRQLRCRVLGAQRPGMASRAAAGLLVPSVGRLSRAVAPFFYRSLEQFPGFLSRVQAADTTLRTIDGLLEITNPAEPRLALIGPPPTRLDQARLAALEPALAHNDGALFHPRDGAIDNVRLLAAL